MDNLFALDMQDHAADVRSALPGWGLIAAGTALLGYAAYKRDRATLAGTVAGAALLYRGIVMARNPEAGVLPASTVDVQRTVSIQRPKQELYDFWAQPANFPRFMMDVESVTPAGPGRQHWKLRTPMGVRMEWVSEVTEVRGEQISWRTGPEAMVQQSGAVEFREGSHPGETYVRMTARYVLPGGMLTRGVAMLAGRDPEQMARENLRRFKQLMEAGEIATTAGQPSGRSRLRNQVTESLYHENAGMKPARERTAS